LQVRTLAVPAHSAAPGVQARARQTPITQLAEDAQGASIHARPRGSQVRARVASTHSDAFGVQTRARQVASAPQACPAGQSLSPTQSTQIPRARSHTRPGHMRDDVHAVTATQRLPSQVCPASPQSAAERH